MFIKLFHKIEKKKRALSNSFYEGSVILISKLEQILNTTNRKLYTFPDAHRHKNSQ